jgi:hypothetical protein
MWKIKWDWEGKRNMKKHNIVFVLFPTIGLVTILYNTKVGYNISAIWLFFQIEVDIRYE